MAKALRRRSHYEGKAQRSYWSTHIEAWLRSGVTRQQYCRENRLERWTMVRWLKVLETPPPPPRRVYKKQVIVNGPRLPATRSRAFFAFWSMHVEAHRLSGLNAARYAEAHRLSVIKFRRLRRRFELNPLAQNWHDLYHPVALDSSQAETNLRQQLRPTVVKRAAVEAPAAPLPTLSSLQRRQYTTARKLAIVAENHRGGVTASMVARRTRSHPIDDRAMAEPVRHDSQGASVAHHRARRRNARPRPPEAHIAARAAESLTRTPRGDRG